MGPPTTLHVHMTDVSTTLLIAVHIFLFYHQVMCLTNQVHCSLALCIQATAIMKPGDSSYLCGCMILFCILFSGHANNVW
jgi:hypothetical protein